MTCLDTLRVSLQVQQWKMVKLKGYTVKKKKKLLMIKYGKKSIVNSYFFLKTQKYRRIVAYHVTHAYCICLSMYYLIKIHDCILMRLLVPHFRKSCEKSICIKTQHKIQSMYFFSEMNVAVLLVATKSYHINICQLSL